MKNIRVGKQTFVMTEKMKKWKKTLSIFTLLDKELKRLGLQRSYRSTSRYVAREWDKLKRMERLNEMEEAESLKERIQRRRMEELRRKKPSFIHSATETR